ncbi:MAG TPA: PAS domain S-box protein [Thermodesulfobacteriota bacterium]|nr:PAS domain S-box protein [Thermodesulfobacteriota bacterium]
MDNYHSLPKRQLKKHFNNFDELSDELKEFIESVDSAYTEFDSDRTMLERSLDLSSQELLQANTDMRAVFNASPDLFLWIDIDGVIFDTKGGDKSDLYLPLDKLIGKKIQNVPPKILGNKFKNAIKTVLKTNSISSVDYWLEIKNGKKYYEARLIPLTKHQIIVIIRNSTEAKEAEGNLRESEERIRLIIENALDAVIMIDEKGTVIDWNSQAEIIFGWSKKEIIGNTMSDMIIPIQHRNAHKKGLRNFLKTGESKILDKRIEITALRKNGEEFPVELSVSPIHMRDKLVFSAFVSDITLRKKAEDNLIRKNKYESIISSVTKSVHSSIDLDKVLQSASDSICTNMDGVDAVAIYIKEDMKAILKAHTGLTSDYIKSAGTIQYPKGFTWKTLRYSKPIYCKDASKDKHIGPAGIRLGTKSYISLPLTYEGMPVGTVNTHSYSKNAFDDEQLNMLKIVIQQIEVAIRNANKANELRQSEERYRTLFDQSPIGICIFDKDMTITECNDAMVRIFQSSRDKIIGLNMHKLKDKTFLPIVEDAIKGKIAYHESFYQASTSNAKLHLLASVVPIKDEAGNVDSVMGVVEDITQRKKDENEIRSLNIDLEKRVAERTTQLRAANNELEAFSYSVSHDLRSPLRALDGFSQAVLEDYHDKIDDKGKDYLTRIRKASQRMSDLIDDLLNLSRLTRSDMEFADVNLSKLVSDKIDELKRIEPTRKIKVNIKNNVNVTGDPRLLNIAIENLIGNAWKFTSKSTNPMIEFGISNNSDKLIYYIKDNGAGFNMEYAGKLFGPFQRLHSDQDYRGSGIGLATVQRVITRHGGKIWAEGKEGKGATFFFTLTEA